MTTLILDNQKVLRRFNGHPERGAACYALPKKRVTVGVKWSLPKKDYVPDDDVHVTPHVALKFLKRYPNGLSKWQVIAAKEHLPKAVEWLLSTCK